MLPELLGKEFYDKKAYPCPLKVHGLSTEELETALNKASQSSYYIMGNGPNYSLKIGKVSQDAKDVAKNVEQALGQVLGYTTCWDSIDFSKVCQIAVRMGSESIDLPVYNSLESMDIDAFAKH
jgi:ribosomal protein L1